MNIRTRTRKVRKAIAAGTLGGLGAIGTAMLDGALSHAEAIAAFGAGVLAGVAVYRVRNDRQ